MILLIEMRNQFFKSIQRYRRIGGYLWLVICCHQLDKVVSWNILYIAIVQNNTRNMFEKITILQHFVEMKCFTKR